MEPVLSQIRGNRKARVASFCDQVGFALVIMQGTGVPLPDRSSDRNEQHRAALQHHHANAACPRRSVHTGARMHLLITRSFLSPDENSRAIRATTTVTVRTSRPK